MTSSFLTTLSQWLHNVNPTLSKIPPRADKVGEYCYMGSDGTTTGATLCTEIGYGHATCVGSWLLSPEHHIIEGLLVTIFALLILYVVVLPKIRSYMPNDATSTTTASITIQHPTWSRGVSIFCLGMILIYKVMGYPSRVYYVVMPCNMQWILSFLQVCIIPNSSKYAKLQYTLLQLRLTYLMSVIIAIVTPETDDCEHFFEFEFYWINHILLLVLPACYILNGSVSTLHPPVTTTTTSNDATAQPSVFMFNMYWWLYGCCVFAIFYFIPVTLMAIYSGLNLNFMLHPPHDHFALQGKYYRLIAVAMLAVSFIISRLLVYVFETSMISNKTAVDDDDEAKKKKQ